MDPDASRPTVDAGYWSRVLSASVRTVTMKQLQGGNSPSRIYRVRPSYGVSAAGPRSVVVKCSARPWSPIDPDGFLREASVYRWLPRTQEAAHPFAAHAYNVDGDSTTSRVVLADLSIDHTFYPQHRIWTRADALARVRAYARLHTHRAEPLPKGLVAAPDRRWSMDVISEAIDTLTANRRWSAVGNTIARLLEALDLTDREPWRSLPDCVLHSDPGPANFAFPSRPEDTAVLIDWHIAAAGMPLFDPAAFFFQPYRNTWALDRTTALRVYLAEYRTASGTDLFANDLREEALPAFRYATAWAGLSYLPALASRIRETGRLYGWWRNLALDILDGFRWCAASREACE